MMPLAKLVLAIRKGSSLFFFLFLSHFLSSSSLFLHKNGRGGGMGGFLSGRGLEL
jgi:hypothetical protein